MSQISKKFIAANAVDQSKFRLDNNSHLRSRNAADSGDVSMFKVNASDRIEFASVPQVTADPSSANDLVRKSYLDAIAQGLKPKQAVRAASTANVVIASALEAGDSIDGVTLVAGDRVLLKDQTDAAENGIYIASASGAASRSSDFDSLSPIDEINGAYTFVQEGSANAGKAFVQVGTVAVLDTDDIDFVFFNSAGTLTGFDMITISGSNVSVDLATASGLESTNPGNAAGQLRIKLEASNPSLKFTGSNELAAKLDAAGAIASGANGLAAQVDSSTIEISSNALRVKDAGITLAKLASDSVDENKIVSTSFNAAGAVTGGSGSKIAVQVDASTIEISANALQVKDAGITSAKLAAAVAGDMIAGGAGSALSVDLHSTSGLESSNPGNAAGQLRVKLEASNPSLKIDGSNQLAAKLDAAGAILSGASGLAVQVASGLEISSNALRISSAAAGNGLDWSAGVLSQSADYAVDLAAPAASEGVNSKDSGAANKFAVGYADATNFNAASMGYTADTLAMVNQVLGGAAMLSTAMNTAASAAVTGDIMLGSGDKTNAGATGRTGHTFISSGFNFGAGNSGNIGIYSGDATTGNSGNIRLDTGAAGANRGNINTDSRQFNITASEAFNVTSVASTINATSGQLILTGTQVTIDSAAGTMIVKSGDSAVASEAVTVTSGQSTGTGASGLALFQSGDVLDAAGGASGDAILRSGVVDHASSTTDSGTVNMASGTVNGSGNSGSANISTGAANSGNSGNINITVGTSASGTRGTVFITGQHISLNALGGNIDAETHKIVNVVDPVSAQDAATKAYVDGLSYLTAGAGLSYSPAGTLLISAADSSITVGADDIAVALAASSGLEISSGLKVKLEASNPSLQVSSGELGVKLGAGIEKGAAGIYVDSYRHAAITLSAGDITAQYYDLAVKLIPESGDLMPDGGMPQRYGVDFDFDNSGAVTRVRWDSTNLPSSDLATGGAAALISGDVLYIKGIKV